MTAAAVGWAACPQQIKDGWAKLRADAARAAGVHVCARSREWAAMPVEMRFALLLLAGIDGDMDALARRAWREMPPPEREALRSVMRGFAAAVKASPGLCGRWGDD